MNMVEMVGETAARPRLRQAEGSSQDERRLLAVFAHPDDESFGTGGALARYAAEGTRVSLVCATRGEVGEIGDPSLATPATLGQVREAELRCAAGILGIGELIFLGYRDSGMAGTPENEHPQAFVNIPGDEVVARLVGIIRRVQPQVVITFDPSGAYGHPDHIAIHQHTVAAFHAAGDAARYPGQGPAWQPSCLFYVAVPSSFLQEMRNELQALGIDATELDRFEEGGVSRYDDQIHAVLNVAMTVDAKWSALHCHRTQFSPNNLFRRLPEATMKRIMSREYFTLALPQPEPGLQLADLFDGCEMREQTA
jgi:LmbE family N-acetylglucosaminyl deacetylase